jgi:enoyl-CoA hydratase/carnithine racemase
MTVVEVTFEDRRADLTLRRPDVLNAMDWDVFEGLALAAEAIAAADDVRVVVVSGEGRSFSSGIDTSALGEFQGSPADTIARAQAGFRKVAALPMPTVAKVQGHAYGAGLQLALACDLRVMAKDASVGLLEARYSLVPDLGGTQRLPLLVGPGRAKKMIWLTERFDGEEAARIGLAELVVDAEELDAAVDELVAGILATPPAAAREVKRLVDLSMRTDLSQGMDEEAVSQQKMFASQDFTEAISAFLEGRPPRYVNR